MSHIQKEENSTSTVPFGLLLDIQNISNQLKLLKWSGKKVITKITDA